MLRSSPAQLVCAALTFVLLAGCGDPLILTQTVGPDGALIELPGGGSLDIPAGALDADTDLGIEIVTDLAEGGFQPLPGYLSNAPDVAVALTPHGTTFNVPATLSLPAPAAIADLVIMRAADEDDADWTSVGPVTFADGLATLSIDGFSSYALVAAGSCPCFDGDDLRAFHARGTVEVSAQGAETTWIDRDAPYSYPPDPVFGMPGSSGTAADVSFGYQLRNSASSTTPLSWVSASWRTEDGAASYGSCTSAKNGTDGTLGSSWSDWFPGFSKTEPCVNCYQAAIDEATFGICRALLRSGRRGDAAHPLAIVAGGIPTGEKVVVALDGSEFDVDAGVPVVWAPTAVAEGSPYAVTIVTQPASATCTLGATATGTGGSANISVDLTCAVGETCNGLDDDGDGDIDEDFDADADGVTTCGADGDPNTAADNDCDDNEATSYPGAPELCDGNDNDCDGNVDAGETTDADSDGVPDACDARPNTACAFYDLADVEATLSLTGAQCLVGATGGSIPAPFATELTSFSGVYADWGSGAWEVAGVGVGGTTGTETFAPYGCLQQSATGPCTDNNRPLLPAGSEATQGEYDACKDVAEYACR